MDNNILSALLEEKEDNLCVDYMGYYNRFLQKELLLQALKNNNKVFMRKAQIAGAFEKSLFTDEEIIVCLIEQLEEGTSTNYILNVLLLTDISVWKNH